MQLIKSPIFIICSVLFIIHQVLIIYFDVRMPMVDSYLDNLLAMPIILTLLLVERKYIFRWKNYERLSFVEVVAATVFIIIVAEVVFPLLSNDFTTDWWDVAFFFSGAILFHVTINQRATE